MKFGTSSHSRILATTLAILTLFAAYTPTTQAQIKSRKATTSEKKANALSETPVVTKAQAFQQFREANPGARFYGSNFYQPTGPGDEAAGMTAVYGTILSTGATPEASAWSHVEEIEPMLGDYGSLVPEIKPNGEILQGVMFNKRTGEHKFQVLRFNQVYNGLPVFRSGVGFMVRNQTANPLVMSGITVKDLQGAAIVAPAGAANVSKQMQENASALMDDQPVLKSVLNSKKKAATPGLQITDAKYIIFAGDYEKSALPELAVQFVAERGSVQTVPDYHKYMVIASAATGEILYSESEICFCSTCLPIDVNGTVSGRATVGLATLECDPEVSLRLPYAEVSIDGGATVNADANGDFTIPNGGSGNVTVRSRLKGLYFEVFDESNGSATPELVSSVTPPGPVDFLHNPTTTDDLMTANVNCYLEANVVRDYVLSYEPTFPTIDTQLGFDINTNIASSCNAFYNGSSINFYQAGGGCNNTASADIIYHEYGHHLINVTGNGQGQMGEGTGDVIGVLIADDPVLGQGFQQNCGAGIRNANNNHQYPCSGGIHDCGQLISGCVWSTRNELIVTEPNDYRDIGASLFLGMLVIRGDMQPGQQTIAPDITITYLELDDDDTEIGNGTPHYDEIAAGFGAHNMDAPPLNLIEFQYPNGIPELVPHDGTPAFTVEVIGQVETPSPGTGTLHVDTGAGFVSYPMNEIGSNLYEAVFPEMDCAIIVNFYVTVDTNEGSTADSPQGAPSNSYTAIVGTSSTVAFEEDFESTSGWAVTGDALDGPWEVGVPVGGGDRGDPANDADGSGQCYLTDNVDGNSDVDDGSTILTSPVMNASSAPDEFAILSYQRWYSNTFGNAPEADVFVVDISNDGGATWTNLETVGPTGSEVNGGWIEKHFRIDEFLTPTSNMRLRFNASDLGDGSVVEAAIDDLQILLVECEDSEVPVTPIATKFLNGLPTSGVLADVFASDDLWYGLDPSPTTNPVKQIVEVILQTEAAITSPTSLSFRLEAAKNGGASTGDVVQTIELFNLVTNSWELIDSRATENSDTSVEASPGGDLSRFMNPVTGETTAKIKFASPSFAGSSYFWTIDVDEAVWIIE